MFFILSERECSPITIPCCCVSFKEHGDEKELNTWHVTKSYAVKNSGSGANLGKTKGKQER